MAYGALISLKQTIQRLLHSSRMSIVYPSRKILGCVYEVVQSLQDILEALDRSRNSGERKKALEGQMREAACELEDALESHVSDQFLSQSASHPKMFSLDLEDLKQHIHSFAKRVKKMEEECIKELDNFLSEVEEDDNGAVSSRMVGLSDQFREIRDNLLGRTMNPVVSIIGMVGIGKTTLARKIFEDPLILRKFDCRIFVKVGPKSPFKKVLRAILPYVKPDYDKTLMMEEIEKLDETKLDDFCLPLNDRNYLIVLDDVWDANFLEDFISSFPTNSSESRILVSTRIRQVATSIGGYNNFDVRFMNKEESWDLLREGVFGETESCPPQLEKAGKKIAENCEGLPLTIITVADLLSKAEKTPEYWNKVAAHKENSIFMDARDQISKVLCRSYNYLPQNLRACFLYMGAFPQNYDVPRSKLINLWSVEGFLEPNPFQILEDFAVTCLDGLLFSNLTVVRQRTFYSDRLKACCHHFILWHLCKREAGNNEFLHFLNSYVDGLTEDMESKRRFSFYKNVLLSIKDVYNSVASVSTARSLLCTGAYHQYQVPMCLGPRLLRVIDALTIRFYEFPLEVLKLIQLRYLALTYNGELPATISTLLNLQFLIVHRHLSIKSSGAPSYLPMEIWDMKELKHLQVMGSNLPDPNGDALLPNLVTLLDVGALSCTVPVLSKVPYLERLRIQIELADKSSTHRYLHEYLPNLRSFQCVMNPELRYEIAVPPPYSYCSLKCLMKLTLSGFGYPWKDIAFIANLSSLQVLKLKRYAFQGEKWEEKWGGKTKWGLEERGFLSLEYLSIEDTDLVQWTVGNKNFQKLRYLTIKNCYKLQEIPNICSLREIRLIDCNPLAVTCAKQMEDDHCHVYANSSWDDRNLKS